ncbi:MAG: hypothetical protein ABII02_01030 [Candidatus Magasanikbacteria bacterium]
MKYTFKSLLVLTLVFIFSGCVPIDTEDFIPEEEKNIDEEIGAAPITFSYIASRDEILGSWYILDGGDAEEIILESDGTFSTFLHDRPFEIGTWSYEDGIMVMSSEELGERMYNDVVFEEEFLILEGEGDLYQLLSKVLEELDTE